MYAFLYGAGDAKIGTIVGGSAKDGAYLKRRFLSNTPSLESLRDRVARASGRGYLTGLDGRRLRVRSEHAALNTLLQAAGAIVMKKALVILDDYAKQWKLDYNFIGNIHDEVQSEVVADQAEKYGWLAVECLKAAGVHFNLRCPLDGEYKVGRTWSETH
ncbi:DNA polymerase, partial [Neptunomonas phycophila]|uniref:DNA polymerase n=1 Tax=Neptunomonas phycophila TaxID=1572645 RepID=UPI0023F8E830